MSQKRGKEGSDQFLEKAERKKRKDTNLEKEKAQAQILVALKQKKGPATRENKNNVEGGRREWVCARHCK